MLVPLFSYLYQRGRCAHCGTKFSAQYPLVEALAGMLFVAIFVTHQIEPFATPLRDWIFALIDACVWATLLAIMVYDLRHKIIPDGFSVTFALLALLALAFKWWWGILPAHDIVFMNAVPYWMDWAAGPVLAMPFATLWLLSGGRAMGLGDAKLAWGIGWFLGFSSGVTAIVLAFWIAFLPSLVMLFLPTKRFTMKSEIPFAPFLVFGTLVTYFFNINILSWSF